ncbi:hypothetical protein BGZ47_005808 [Haplosporangium gracile]|nr:hypothetical protein BGZ47_005808 [Haplosporangium gracile]
MTRRLLTISFSLFLVSAMMGTFPIPGTNSVSIPPSGTLLESPSSSSSSSTISVATDAEAVAGTGATTTPTTAAAADITPQLTNVIESSNTPPGAESPGLIEILRDESSTSKIPTAMSSGFYKSGVSPPSGSKQPGSPQKRAEQQEQMWRKWSPSQDQGQQGQQWYQQGQGQGQQWYPSQGQQVQQWYQQGQDQGQQWYPSQGQQGQQGQWYQEGPQWYQQQGQGRGQQLGKPYTAQKRAIAASTLAPIMDSMGIAATAPQGGSPTYRMSSLVCNLDTTTHGLIHCSDYKDYYTLGQPANPANSADPRNRPWSTGSSSPAGQGANTGSGPAAAIVKKRAVTTQGVGYQSSSTGTPVTLPDGVIALAVDSQGWFRHPQPYGAQPYGAQPYGAQPRPQARAQTQFQAQTQQAQVYKRQVAGAAAAAAADATNQAAASIVAANHANAIAAAIHRQHGSGLGSTSSSGNVDLDNLSKWSGSGYTGGSEGGDWYGKDGSTGYGKAWTGGKKWKREDFDEGNWSKWSGTGAGPGYGGRDEWSHYGKAGKKWGKRVDLDEGNLSKWSGGRSSYGDDWSHYGKGGSSGYDKGGKKWNKRQVFGAAAGGPGDYGRGVNTGAIPVPIDVGLVWDGNSVNLVPPPSSRGAGSPSGPVPGAGGIPADATVVGGDSPAIPVPINVDALVYPDGQMQIFPFASAN